MNRVQRDDEGAALLIALGFIALFGVTIAAILSFADTSLRASDTVQTQRGNVFAADGAVEATIAAMRGNVAMGTDGSPTSCDQTVQDLNGHNVVVTCTPHAGSGTGGGGGGTGDAIITTATLASGEYGMYRDANGDLPIGGNIRSNSTLKLGGGGTITATGDITATGACDALVTTTKTKNCGAGVVTTVPNYASKPIVATPGTHTACTAVVKTVVFTPGTFTSAADLNNMMKSNSACSGSFYYFPAGTYYFNFTAGDDEWIINDANLNLLGGVPVGFVPVPGPTRPIVPAFPASSCDSSVAGVQFVFGGASRMRVDAGTIELCPALANGTDPPIAIYGSTNVVAPPATLVPTGFDSPADFDNVNPGAFTIGDGGSAKTHATLTNAQTATVTLSGFNQTTIPSGATIQTATLRVVHQDGNGKNNNDDFDTGSVTLKKGATSCPALAALTKKAAMGEQSWDVKSCLASPADYSNIKVTYSVTAADAKQAKKLDDYLDGVAIDVTYVNPGLTPQSGCITKTGFPQGGTDSTHCAIWKISGSNSSAAIRGMLYAPNAPVDLAASSASQQGYLRGIIARTIRANVTPSVAFAPAISTPSPVPSTPNDRVVDLVATIDGVVKLKATVTFKDQPTPGKTVTINRWTVVR